MKLMCPLWSGRVPVVCAVSGGVDSAVTLLRLLTPPHKHQYEVTCALYMRNWDAREEIQHTTTNTTTTGGFTSINNNRCTSDKDEAFARQVCDRLGVQLHLADFSKDYWNEVFSTMICKYKQGLTPNPDILCNRHIKFGSLRTYIDLFFGPDHLIATGHYGRTARGSNGLTKLLIPKDKVKDQTFFLSQIRQEALQKTIFPLSDLVKPHVKRIANESNLGFVNEKKESMGLCFVGDRKFNHFLRDYIPVKKGPIVQFESGKVVGQHEGVQFYTPGMNFLLPYIQKQKQQEVFVYDRDAKTNTLYVVNGRANPLLWRSFVRIHNVSWISNSKPLELTQPGAVFSCQVRMQHGYPLMGCDVKLSTDCEYSDIGSEVFEITTYGRTWAVTPGQFAVLYKDGECLGSGENLPFKQD